MARRFEADYRVTEADDVLSRENDIHRDIDLRLDDVEKGVEAFRSGQRDDIEAILNNLEETYSGLAAEMRRLLDQAEGGLSADIIVESAARRFLTDARRAAILADALAAAQDAAAGRVSKAGDTMTGNLAIKKSDASFDLTQSGGSYDTFAWRVMNWNVDGRLYFQDYRNGQYQNNAVSFGRDGSINSAAFSGDLKTYVDKGVRTDVAQAFNAAQRQKAKVNLGVGGVLNPINAAYNMPVDGINKAWYVTGDAYQVTLPIETTFGNGDYIDFINVQGGTVTIARNGSSSANFAGGSASGLGGGYATTIKVGPAQSVRIIYDGANWTIGFRAITPERALSVDPQTFTDAQKQQLLANADIAIPVGQCRLNYVSSTQIRLDWCDGNKIFINGNYRTIPSGGITMSNAGLSANVMYYVYVYYFNGAITMFASTVAPVVDPTYGHKVGGGPANTLVGAIVTGGSGEFVDSSQYRQVASYFNRRRKNVEVQVAAGGSSGNTLFSNLGNEAYVFSWGDDAVEFQAVGSIANQGTQITTSLQCYIDGAAASQDATQHNGNSGTLVSLTPCASRILGVGLHRLSIYGKVSGSTSSYYVGMYGSVVL